MTIYHQKEIRIEGIFEALKIALLSSMKEGCVTSGEYTVYFKVVTEDDRKHKKGSK